MNAVHDKKWTDGKVVHSGIDVGVDGSYTYFIIVARSPEVAPLRGLVRFLLFLPLDIDEAPDLPLKPRIATSSPRIDFGPVAGHHETMGNTPSPQTPHRRCGRYPSGFS